MKISKNNWFIKSMSMALALMLLSVFLCTSCTKKSETASGVVLSAVGQGENRVLPVVKDPASYRMAAVVYPNQKDFNESPFFKELEKRTNVMVKFDCYLQSGSYNEQKNVMLMSNTLPDAFFGAGTLTMNDINTYGPQGMFIPLDDLIEKYAPRYSQLLKANPLLDGLTTSFDGKKYTMGTVIEQDIRSYPDNLYINKVWLDKLGLPMPTTLEEFYNVLIAFKTKDPNGNGKADEIPYSFVRNHHITGYGSFFGSFGMVDPQNFSGSFYEHFLVDERGKVFYTANKVQYKEAIDYLKKFVTAGLWDPEGFTQESGALNAKLQSPIAIVGTFFGWANGAAGLNQDQYIAVPPLKGPKGEVPTVKKRMNQINFQGTGFAITPNAKNPELLVQWIDYLYEQDMSIQAQFGLVDLGIVETAPDVYDFIRDDGPGGITYLDMRLQNGPQDNAPKFISADMFNTVIPYDSNDQMKFDVIKKYYLPLKSDVTLPNMNFTVDEIAIHNSIGVDVMNYVNTSQANWLMGKSDINKDWDTYIAQLDKLGLPKLLESMQKTYDRSTGK